MNIDALLTFLFDLLYNGDELDNMSHTHSRVWRSLLKDNRFEVEPEPRCNAVAVRIWTGHCSIHRWYNIVPQTQGSPA